MTFLGIWVIQRERAVVDTVSELRDAIAGTVVIVYVVILSWSTFFPRVNESLVLNSLTSTFITNFTALTGIVVGIYFASTAAAQIKGGRTNHEDHSSAQP